MTYRAVSKGSVEFPYLLNGYSTHHPLLGRLLVPGNVVSPVIDALAIFAFPIKINLNVDCVANFSAAMRAVPVMLNSLATLVTSAGIVMMRLYAGHLFCCGCGCACVVKPEGEEQDLDFEQEEKEYLCFLQTTSCTTDLSCRENSTASFHCSEWSLLSHIVVAFSFSPPHHQ